MSDPKPNLIMQMNDLLENEYSLQCQTWRDIENKASTMLAFSGALITALVFFVASAGNELLGPVAGVLLLLAAISSVISIIFDVIVLRVTWTELPPQGSDVLQEMREKDDLSDPEFWSGRWGEWANANRELWSVNNRKAERLYRAQDFLLVSIAFLVVVLGLLLMPVMSVAKCVS